MLDNLNKIYDILKQDERLVATDGSLMKNKVFELASKLDNQLLKILLDNEFTRKIFFNKIDEIFIFDKARFGWLIDSKEFLPESYSSFKNDIMLIDNNNNSIANRDNVMLSFPYKDCVLEMDSTEDTEIREEVFFNETLMKSEIDTLLAPKTLVNAKKYTKDGATAITGFDEKDNLIIKGNNLLALHSLKSRYKGKIKCMYWDILYNREKDYVPYNDSFKHTSWLTMMKNRLDIAKELLKKDGVIFLQCDDTEIHYLKVLCDEIFDRENYVNTISVKMKNVAGASGGGEDKRFKKNIEYILIYAKDYNFMPQFKSVYKYTEIHELVEDYRNNGVSWKYTTALIDGGEKEFLGKTVDGDGNDITIYRRNNYVIKSVGQIIKEEQITEKEVYYKYGKCMFQTAMPQSSIRPRVMEKLSELGVSCDLISIEYVPKTGRNKGNLYEQYYKGESCRLFAWLRDVSEEIDGVLYKKDMQGTLWDFVGETKNLTKEGQVQLANGKKPERLIDAVLSCCMDKGDIVLDAYLGSGTTAAVAHKKGLQYIGLEQLDRHMELAKERLQNVINGDESGISKETQWTGGGSYVYCELAENSQTYIHKIKEASTHEQLIFIYDELKTSEFISYRVDINKMEAEQDRFLNLSIDDKKKFLISIIDKNTLYINYADVENEDFMIEEKDKAFNNSFYKGV